MIDDRDPPDLPDWLFYFLADRCQPSIYVGDGEQDLTDDEIDRDYPYAWRLYRGQRLCEEHEPAIQGENGSGASMQLAVHSYRVSFCVLATPSRCTRGTTTTSACRRGTRVRSRG